MELNEVPKTNAAFSVLLAEDHAITAKITRMLLERSGCLVDCVVDGQEAVSAVQRKRYDLIFMDCFMPNLDGFDATSQIRNLTGDYFKNVPIIALTAGVQPEEHERCYASGMSDLLLKPINFEILHETISRWTQDSL